MLCYEEQSTWLVSTIGLMRCAAPYAQPIFQPVHEKVLPHELMVIVLSHISGREASRMCFFPSNISFSYTSSVMAVT
jgi:hypothetical protein